jgi:hypothetical protein
MKYEDLLQKMQERRRNKLGINHSLGHRWDYNRPYEMLITDIAEGESGRLNITFAIKLEKDYVEKTISFITEGKGAFFWDDFITKAFPNPPEGLSLEDIIGRPFRAEIVKNDRYDNISILSGYTGSYSDEVE